MEINRSLYLTDWMIIVFSGALYIFTLPVLSESKLIRLAVGQLAEVQGRLKT